MFDIQITNEQSAHAFAAERLVAGCRAVLSGEGLRRAQISLAVIDDPAIREINRKFLQHDYATDVISFVLEDQGNALEGEVIVSADTAATMAAQFGWTTSDELLLYVIHGTLHLCGYDDLTDEALPLMRAAEHKYLAEFGLTPRYAESAFASEAPSREAQS